jgi:hypothetical protein
MKSIGRGQCAMGGGGGSRACVVFDLVGGARENVGLLPTNLVNRLRGAGDAC